MERARSDGRARGIIDNAVADRRIAWPYGEHSRAAGEQGAAGHRPVVQDLCPCRNQIEARFLDCAEAGRAARVLAAFLGDAQRLHLVVGRGRLRDYAERQDRGGDREETSNGTHLFLPCLLSPLLWAT